MSWNYAAIKCTHGDEVWYEVCECYPDMPNRIEADGIPHTKGLSVRGESTEELVEMLRAAADDVEKYGVVNV